MAHGFQPNLKRILAAICVLAGMIILWRSFVGPQSVATVEPGQAGTNLTEFVSPLPTQPPVIADSYPIGDNSGAAPVSPPYPGIATEPTTMPATATLALPPSPEPLTPTLAISDIPATLTTPTGVEVSTTPNLQPTPAVPRPSATLVPTQIAPATPIPTRSLATSPLPTQAGAPPATPTPTNPATLPPSSATIPIPSPTPAPTATTISNQYAIVFRVEGDGSTATVDYNNGSPDDTIGVQVQLPWTLQFSLPNVADLYISASNDAATTQSLTCSIYVNGKLEYTDTKPANRGVECEWFPK